MNRLHSVVGVIALVGCTANPATTGEGPVTADQACADYADRFCELEQQCEPGWLKYIWGNVATCRERQRVGCPEAFELNGTMDTPSRLESCAKAMRTQSCDDFLRPWPDVCRQPLGTLPDGMACGGRSQCRGGSCKQGIAACGTCVTTLPEGAPCTSRSECDVDATCGSVDGICTRQYAVELGGACDFDHTCAGTLTCRGSGATGMGTCSMPLPEGASCDPSSSPGECDFTKSLGCDSGTNKCAPDPVYPSVGERCLGDLCDGSGTCGAAGTCLPKLHEGQACSDPDQCLRPARCVNGTCTIFDPGSCH
jgi:hypothetical protein